MGKDIPSDEILEEFDAVCLACGAMQPRDLEVEGRELKGIYFAMDFLKQQNKILQGKKVLESHKISASNKKVLVIGGGDTGSDCVGTAVRQKAASVTQIEILDRPTLERTDDNPWPFWPNTLRTSSSHLEGCERRWNLTTRRFIGDNGRVTGVEAVQLEWKKENGRFVMKEIPGTTEIIKADLILLAMGFVSPIRKGLLDDLKMEYDLRGNLKSVNNFTGIDKVFAAGDATRGASLVVHAIRSGRDAAFRIHEYLEKK